MTTKATGGNEAGFSLVEAIIAVLVFIIGIAAISNMFVMAMTANSTANVSAGAAGVASEVMDRLRALPSNTLTATTGANPYASQTAHDAYFQPSAGDSGVCSEETGTTNCVRPGNFVLTKIVPGVGIVHAKWHVTQVGGGTNLLFITVRAQTMATVVGERGNAEFTMFRY